MSTWKAESEAYYVICICQNFPPPPPLQVNFAQLECRKTASYADHTTCRSATTKDHQRWPARLATRWDPMPTEIAAGPPGERGVVSERPLRSVDDRRSASHRNVAISGDSDDMWDSMVAGYSDLTESDPQSYRATSISATTHLVYTLKKAKCAMLLLEYRRGAHLPS